MTNQFNKIILVVLDGFGVASPSAGNAITLANPPFLRELIASYPVKTLQASGPAAGLPWGESGNSEVGHLNLGAGRVVTQELPRINQAIADGSFYKKEAFLQAMEQAVKNESTLHLIGLIGNGRVHAYEQHLYTLIGMAKEKGVKFLNLHLFTDGRDAPAKAALDSVLKLEKHLSDWPGAFIATITGRFYAMDRGEHWQLTEETVKAIVTGTGEYHSSAEDVLRFNYDHGVYDEMIKPSVITNASGQSLSSVSPGDAAIFFNFRDDRMVQLLTTFKKQTQDVVVATMTNYTPEVDALVAFESEVITNSLGEIISKQDWMQFRAAESEKQAHVTFFFNGHRHDPWPKEERLIVKSPKANTKNYEDVPEMSAHQLADQVAERINTHDDHFLLVNFANGDMVGHTGNLAAAQKAVTALDQALKKIATASLDKGALMMITADHGNCESMINDNNAEIDKNHSTNPVPLIFVANEFKKAAPAALNFHNLASLSPSGFLSDIAPTILHYLGLEKPAEMNGSVLTVD